MRRTAPFIVLVATCVSLTSPSPVTALGYTVGQIDGIFIKSPGPISPTTFVIGDSSGFYIWYENEPAGIGVTASLDFSALGAHTGYGCSDPGPTGMGADFDCYATLPLSVTPGPVRIFLVTRLSNGIEHRLPIDAVVLPPRDTDRDGLPDVWETLLGLDYASADGDSGAVGDPDHDGVTNADEYARRTHPRGFYTRFVAEMMPLAYSSLLAVGNDEGMRHILIRSFDPGVTQVEPACVISSGAWRRSTYISACARFEWWRPGRLYPQGAVIESDTDIDIARFSNWNTGWHASEAARATSTTWYFAEGVVAPGFASFVLLMNPGPAPADVAMTFLGEHGAPLTHDVRLEPASTRTVWLDAEVPQLAGTSFGMVVESSAGIVAERSTYLVGADAQLGGGSGALGVVAPRAEWYFAEGATGELFSTYLLLANPSATDADVTITVHSDAGTLATVTRRVAALRRTSIDMATIAPGLGAAVFGMSIRSSAPIVAERAMWFPGRDRSTWTDGHASHGLDLARHWLVPASTCSYVLVLNPGAQAAVLSIASLRPGPIDETTLVTVPASSRVTFDVFDHANGTMTGIEVVSGPPIAVECSMYNIYDAVAQRWRRGANLPAFPVPLR